MSWQELPLDRIYFDSVTGVPGITWPIGTPGVPSDVIADVILMCAARNLRKIDVHGLLTLGDTMEHYTFIGHRHEAVADTLALAGHDVDESTIISCLVSGAQGGTGFLTLEDCILYLLTDFQGIANYCDLYGSAMSLKDGGFQDLHHCNSVHSDLTITVNAPTRASFKEMAGNCQFTGERAGGVLYVRGYKGTLVINDMTGGDCDIYANGADITINANCTGGTINIYGSAIVTDNSGATVVNDHTLETAKVEAYGTADAGSDADTLVDDALTQGDDYWKGLTLLMITGANAGLTRPIVAFTDAGDTMELRPAFPAAIAAGDVYAILSNYHEVVPDVDSAENYLPRDVLGNKADTALQAATAADSLMRYVKGLLLGQSRQLFTMDFWSALKEEIVVTGAQTTPIPPPVVVEDLPGDAVIVRAIVMMKFRMVENDYAGENKLDAAAILPMQVDDGVTGMLTCIDFVDEAFTLAEATREGGDVIVGDIDVAARVDGNDTYNFQWLNAKALGDNLRFNDVQMGIRIWYSV